MATHTVLIDHTAPSVSHISVAVATITGLHSAKLRVLRITLHLAYDKIMCFVTLLHYNIQLSLASALASTYHSYKQTLGPFQHIHCPLYSPTQIAACHRHLYVAQARPHDAVSICLVQANTQFVSASTMYAMQSNANSCMPSAPLARSDSPP